MQSCCDHPEESSKPGEGEMPAMMQKMMEHMKGGMKDFNPMAACQAMMTSVSKSAEMAAYATDEVRMLFEEWAGSVADELLSALKSEGSSDLETLAAAMKLSPEATLYFLGKLVRDGKATITGIEARE